MSIFSWLSSKPDPKNTVVNRVKPNHSKSEVRSNPAAAPSEPAQRRFNTRRESRQDSCFITVIIDKNHEIPATVVNFSETGLGLVTKEPINSGTSVEVTLALKGELPVMVPAKIMSCRKADQEYMLGLKTSVLGGRYASLLKNLNLHGSAFSTS